MSVIVAVPEEVVVELAVKTEVLVFKVPLPERVRAPLSVMDPVVLPVKVPAIAVVPVTDNVLAAAKFRVKPEFTTRLWMVTPVLMVTLVLMITSSPEAGVPAGDHVTVDQFPAEVDVFVTPNA